MDNSNRGKLFELFCSTDELRENIMKPWTYQGKTGATDGQAVVFIEGVIPEEGYKEIDLNIASVLPVETAPVFLVDVSHMKMGIENSPSIPVYECPQCDYISNYATDECEEHDVKMRKTAKLEKSPFFNLWIGKVSFAVIQVQRLVEAAEIIGAEKFVLMSDNIPERAHLFGMGDVRFVQMPTRGNLGDGIMVYVADAN